MIRSACPICKSSVTLAKVMPGAAGFETQSFECRSCDYAEDVVVTLDPMNPHMLGWLSGELGTPPQRLARGNAITHTIVDGRMVPHLDKQRN
jgi:hypothetical protein